MMTRIKNQAEIAAMRESGRLLATVLAALVRRPVAGMSTKELADIAKAELRALGGQPAFVGYNGFPDVLCVSVNDEVVHGIPRADKYLKDGDIVGLDFGVTYRGMITDAARSVIVGGAGSADVRKLLTATARALDAGIAAVRDGVRTGDIAHAVQSVLDRERLGIIRDLVGHGVGHHLHEEPNLPNYGHAGSGLVLHAGMTVALEPMATLGGHKIIIDRDGWTVRTADGSWSAHFEDTVLITDDGAEILTRL